MTEGGDSVARFCLVFDDDARVGEWDEREDTMSEGGDSVERFCLIFDDEWQCEGETRVRERGREETMREVGDFRLR